MHSLEIAQRFNAGFRLKESLIFPALKRWAIFASTDECEHDSLRIAS
jgi:hypothetical protein